MPPSLKDALSISISPGLCLKKASGNETKGTLSMPPTRVRRQILSVSTLKLVWRVNFRVYRVMDVDDDDDAAGKCCVTLHFIFVPTHNSTWRRKLVHQN